MISAAAARAIVPADRRALIAVDLGAESCRISLLRWSSQISDTRARLQLVHRFANGPRLAADGSLRWPLATILDGVDEGVRRCAALAPEGIRSLAVDGWAVDYVRLDYVRLDADRHPLDDPFCYRDDRTAAAAAELHQHIAPERLRTITGVAQQPINTLYQLYADTLADLSPASWLNLPEYLLHRWGGDAVAEETNASHTQLVDLATGTWSAEIFEHARLDLTCAPRIVAPGTLLGDLRGPLASISGLEHTQLIAPACHDTASAIAGIAQHGNDWAYISCGTWSLVGRLLQEPLNSAGARKDNFTNLAAVGGAVCFHKGINGMWLLKQCMDHWASEGLPWDLSALLEAASAEAAPDLLLDIDAPSLHGLGDMPSRINTHRAMLGQPALRFHSADAPAIVSLLLHSLAQRYAEVLARLVQHTGKPIRRIVMVGGGARNGLLRRLTAEKTGLEVVLGPAESSTIGNLAVQLAALERPAATSSAAFAASVSAWSQHIGCADLEAR